MQYQLPVRDNIGFVALDWAGAITVVGSHRCSTVRMADPIVVIDQARILDAGSHEELMQRHGLYAELSMVEAQAYR